VARRPAAWKDSASMKVLLVEDEFDVVVLDIMLPGLSGYVRRKIDIPFGTNTIETVRGVGYRPESSTYTNGN
jgi:DNA-binding response OmpR family regulator